MASRSSGVYSRRPPDDDRDERHDDRRRDSRDERRRDTSRDRHYRGYHRGDEYKEKERYRRDDSPPSRRHPSDSPRDPSVAHFNASRSEASRPDDAVRPKNPPPSHLPHDNENKKVDVPVSAEKAKAIDVSKALKRYGDALKEASRLRLQKEIMEKNLKQRERDYDKSNHQHAPYPSVAELQNKYRRKLEDDIKLLQENLRKQEAKEADAVQAFVRFFTGRVPTIPADSPDPTKFFEAKLASLEAMLHKQDEAHKKALKEQEEKEAQLRQQLQQIQSQRDIQKLDFQNHIQSLKEEMSKKMLEIQQELDKKITTVHSQNADNLAKQSKEHLELKGHVGKLADDLDGRNKAAKSKHDNLRKELKNEITKEIKISASAQTERLAKVEQQLHELISNPSKSEAPAAEVASLQASFCASRDEINKKIDDQAGLIDVLGADLARIVMKVTQNLPERLEERIKCAEDKISQIDFDGVEAATEMASFGFPDLQRKLDKLQPANIESRFEKLETSVGTLQSSVRAISTTLDDNNTRLDDAESNIEAIHHQVGVEATKSKEGMESLSTSLTAYVQESLEGLSEAFGKIINSLREADERLELRLQTLERKVTAEQSSAPAQIGLKRTSSAARLASPDTPSSTFRVDSSAWKSTTEKLSKDLAALAEKIQKLEGTVQQHREKVAQLGQSINPQAIEALEAKVDMVKTGVESLDDRFNNLTTKHLAEHMIGTLQQLWPNEAQLKADIDFLKRLIRNLEGRMQEFTGKVEKVDDNMAKMMLDLKENRAQTLSDDSLNKSGLKRRRTDSNPNGNGFNRTASNGAQ